MSELIHKKHNVSVLLYHLVCPTKYRRAVLTPEVDEKLKEICGEISLRYEIEFLEIGTDSEHVHFLVQSVPMYSPRKIVRTIKSITAKEIFRQLPEVKKQLWGGEFCIERLLHQHSRSAQFGRSRQRVCQKSRWHKSFKSTDALLIPRGSAARKFIRATSICIHLH